MGSNKIRFKDVTGDDSHRFMVRQDVVAKPPTSRQTAADLGEKARRAEDDLGRESGPSKI